MKMRLEIPIFQRKPLPDVAAIGHLPNANDGSNLMMAMAHDYRIMNPHKGFLCLNELEFGAGLSLHSAGWCRKPGDIQR
jgi:hypothetical protein